MRITTGYHLYKSVIVVTKVVVDVLYTLSLNYISAVWGGPATGFPVAFVVFFTETRYTWTRTYERGRLKRINYQKRVLKAHKLNLWDYWAPGERIKDIARAAQVTAIARHKRSIGRNPGIIIEHKRKPWKITYTSKYVLRR